MFNFNLSVKIYRSIVYNIGQIYLVFCISENFYLKEAEKRKKICFWEEKNTEMLCMFQKCCTFAPSKQKDDNRSLILGYGVMVTQQILVLFFLVRVRVAQQKKVF